MWKSLVFFVVVNNRSNKNFIHKTNFIQRVIRNSTIFIFKYTIISVLTFEYIYIHTNIRIAT